MSPPYLSVPPHPRALVVCSGVDEADVVAVVGLGVTVQFCGPVMGVIMPWPRGHASAGRVEGKDRLLRFILSLYPVHRLWRFYLFFVLVSSRRPGI